MDDSEISNSVNQILRIIDSIHLQNLVETSEKLNEISVRLTSLIVDIEDQIERTRIELNLSDRLRELEIQNVALENEKRRLDEERNRLNQELAPLRGERDTINRQMEELASEIRSNSDRIKSTNDSLIVTAVFSFLLIPAFFLPSLAGEIEHLEARGRVLQDQKTSLENRIEAINESVRLNETRRRANEIQLNENNRQIEIANDELRRNARNVTRLRNILMELSSKKSQFESLEEYFFMIEDLTNDFLAFEQLALNFSNGLRQLNNNFLTN
jgi:chromosome segregation ATPase